METKQPKRKKGNSRGPIRKFTYRINVSVSKKWYDLISVEAKTMGISKAECLRLAMDELLGSKYKL